MKFTELDLKPDILKALKSLGYEDLTPIQEETFPHITAGRDIIALAETGSGKTSACGVPLIQSIDPTKNTIQALIMVPTRELALQYVSAISDIAKFMDIAPFAVYGGFSIETQKAKLAHGVQVLIATPGRLIDLIYNYSPLSLSDVQTFILDEADEMLNMGFVTDIDFIVDCLIHEHQTLLFSATMVNSVKALAKRYLKDPVTLQLNAGQVAPQSLDHQFISVFGKEKFPWLVEYMEREKPEQTIVFCHSRRNCERLFDHLREKIDSVEMIHGGLEQSKRSSIFNRFKKKQINVIVATGIASRGLDFSHVTHVMNYDFPDCPTAYTHRTGRTARMGRKGTAVTFFSKHDLRDLKTIIDSNSIEPIWLGEEPNLESIRRSSKPKSFKRGRNFKGRHKRKRPSTKR
ncbi:MAG: DEAD/DEAH box helicase [Anaerohalosphaeraceae bacterium]|nr:DEAD/DEAH box helicase [Anaerohalosphaeraceae bacterium]